jgi:RecJ-like exonuclease
MSFLAYPDCDRCSGSGYITRASYDGHRTDYDQEQCPRCKKNAGRPTATVMLLGSCKAAD